MWIEKTFAKLGYTYMGLRGKSKSDFGNGKPYIPYMNIFGNERVDSGNFEYVQVGRGERQNAVAVGDALFTTSSETPEEVGMSSVLTEDVGTVYLNSFCFGLRLYRPSELDPVFLSYALRSEHIRKQMRVAAQGSTRHNLSKQNFNRMTLCYPEDVSEQRRIADVLKSADDAIFASRALVKKYADVKVGLMQGLLGRGERISFGTVTEDKFQYGLNAAAMPFDGENSYLRITDIDESTRKFSKLDIKSPSGKLTDAYLLAENDIVFARTGASVGKTYIYNPDDGIIYFAGFLVRCRVSTAYCAKYIFYQTLTNDYKRWVIVNSQRSGQPGINATQYEKYEFNCPPLSEQKRIVEILTAADHRLSTEQNHLTKLNNIKQGLMNDLLKGVHTND